MSFRLLIVEDEESLRVALADVLEEEGYQVVAVPNGESARKELMAGGFHLVVLDLMLPDVDGYTLTREVRKRGQDVRILMLTARSLEDDVVRGFECGADDYVEKPNRLRELLARISALLRRAGALEATGSIRFDGFVFDAVARKVSDASGQVIELTKTEFEVLSILLRQRDRALSRDEIIDHVWGAGVVVDPRTVDNFISSLKRKLGWTSKSGFRFQAVRGVGYRMEVDAPKR